jgi:co-chaperonin GroES (HSP10)
VGIPKLEECAPGVAAVGFRIIVAVEPVASKTAGGLHLPDSMVDKGKLVQVRGRIVSVGSVAFDFARFPEGTAPKVGDAVMFAKLAGFMFDGTDGKEYRVLHDQDISAVILEDAA